MKYGIILLLVISSTNLFAQSATYKLVNKSNGSYSNISVRQTSNHLDVNVLANWNSKLGTYGEYNGSGTLMANRCTLNSDSTSCRVTLEFSNDSLLQVGFTDCEEHMIPEDFSGTYTKIADNVPGEYVAVADISYFYSKPDDKSRKKGFFNKSQVMNIEEMFAGDWGFATLMTNGKHSFGYVKLSDLKLKRTYLYDN